MYMYIVGSKEEMYRELAEELDLLPPQKPSTQQPPSTSSTETGASLPLESEFDSSQPSSSFVAPPKKKISGKYAQSGMCS